MIITTGKVHGGTIQVDAKSLPEGAKVTVLAEKGDDTFELQPKDEAKLLRQSPKPNGGKL